MRQMTLTTFLIDSILNYKKIIMLKLVAMVLVALYALYLLGKYILKPYLRMLRYAKYRGAIWIPFVPVLGAFKHAEESFRKTGDENFFSKKSFEENPQARFFIFNAFDKCFLLVVDPNLLQDFFQKQEHYVKEEKFIENKVRFFGHGVAFAQGQEWSKRRKIMSSIFHFSFFNKFIPKITDIADREIAQIRGHDKYCFQAQEISALISGDTIVKTFFGIAFNEKIEDEPISVWMSKLISDTVSQERSLRYFFFGLKLLEAGIFKEDKDVNRRIALFKALAKDLIERKLAQETQEEGTVLQSIQEKGLLNSEEGYTVEQLIDEFMGFFVAGTDTTAHLMTMCYYYLSLYPNHQDTLRKEILQSKILQNLQFRTISNLKFLQAFVKQTFRHYNYMVSTFPRVCLRTHTIGDITVNEGDLVMPGWAQNMYNQKYFPNPDNFDPTRWLQPEDKQLTYIFTPFSVGSRSCLGQNFALLETKIVLIKMVNQFVMALRPGYKHLLKTNSLYGPVNPIIIDLKDA